MESAQKAWSELIILLVFVFSISWVQAQSHPAKTIVRGVYTKEEKAILEDWEKRADSAIGWHKMSREFVASKDSIQDMGLAVDFWNPLWHDDNYARNTRWGTIIAPPMYLERVKQGTGVSPTIPRSHGYTGHYYLGEDWEFYQAVQPNDSFRVWSNKSQLVDVTSPDGNGPRTFTNLLQDLDIINQRDELVNKFKLYLEFFVLPEPPEVKNKIKEEYRYTKEELEEIDRIANKEEVRGANIRYWEHVNTGDDIGKVILGPTTLYDQLILYAVRSEEPFIPAREVRKQAGPLGPMMIDPETNVTHIPIEWHFSRSQAQLNGEPQPFHFGAQARTLMARLITNWMGDDGFVRRFSWRHMVRTPVGDTVFCSGKVINKRVENGEHLVDLSVWQENIRGHVTEAAIATVSLLSKETPNRKHSADYRQEISKYHKERKTADIKIGDKVRIKDRNDWPFASGNRLMGSEGVVIKLWESQDVMEDFQEYLNVQIEKTNADVDPGTALMFRVENLEKK